jgi:hypothetical protein
MNKNPLLIAFLCLTSFFAYATLTRACDDDKIRFLVAKAGDQTAKVTIGSQTYLVPISIEKGLSWDDVKDGYELPPAYISLLKQGRIAISITCSGTSFSVVRRPQ